MPKRRAKDRPKRPDSAALAKPKKVHIVHGGKSNALITAAFDGRTKIGRSYQELVKAMEIHLGNDLTTPQRRLVDQVARLAILSSISWEELIENGLFIKGVPAPALDTFLRATGHERDILKLLGLKRRTKKIPSLKDYIGENDDEQT